MMNQFSTARRIALLEKKLLEMEAKEACLVSENNMLRLLYEQAPLSYQSLDEDGCFISVNEAWLSALGYRREEVIGKNFGDFLHPDWRGHFKENFPRFKAVGEILGVEFQMQKKDGSYIFVSFNGKIGKDFQGFFKRTYCIFQDITRQKQAEEALIRSENKWRNIIVSMPQIGIILDPQGRIVFANAYFLNLVGRTEQEVVGQDWFEMFIPNQVREQVRKQFSLVMKDVSNDFSNYENEIVTKTGELRDVFWSNVPSKDIYNRITDITCMGVDLTERKLAEEKFKIAFKSAPIGILLFNSESIVVDCNDFFAAIFGARRENYLGMNLLAAIQDGPVRQKLADAIADGQMHKYEGTYTSIITGKRLQLSISTEKVAADLFIALFQDITERKNFEMELQTLNEELERRVEQRTIELQETQSQYLHAEKLSAIGKLSASIAHEFNSPLQSVMTVLKGLKNTTALEEVDKKLLDLAIGESERMKNLIRSLQSFNRPSSSRKVLTDVHQSLESILLLIKSDLSRKRISTVLNFAERLPQIVAVKDQLQQVFLNLLSNAADACQEHGRLITISTWQVKQRIAVAIQDNGMGIEPENLDQIFQPFYSTKPEVKGTGLGLSICYGIIQNHHGEIRVVSQLGEGSTFTILLPIAGE